MTETDIVWSGGLLGAAIALTVMNVVDHLMERLMERRFKNIDERLAALEKEKGERPMKSLAEAMELAGQRFFDSSDEKFSDDNWWIAEGIEGHRVAQAVVTAAMEDVREGHPVPLALEAMIWWGVIVGLTMAGMLEQAQAEAGVVAGDR